MKTATLLLLSVILGATAARGEYIRAVNLPTNATPGKLLSVSPGGTVSQTPWSSVISAANVAAEAVLSNAQAFGLTATYVPALVPSHSEIDTILGKVGMDTIIYGKELADVWKFGRLTVAGNLHFNTNVWAGPTNVLDLTKPSQSYSTVTPCEITGVTGKSNTVASAVVLTLYNAASSNVTLTLPASLRTGDYARSYTLSNACVGMLSLEYSPIFGGMTNAVFRDFK